MAEKDPKNQERNGIELESSTYSNDKGSNQESLNKNQGEKSQYRTAREYAHALQPWLYQYYIWSTINSFPSMMTYQTRCYLQANTPASESSITNNNNSSSSQSQGQTPASPPRPQPTPQAVPRPARTVNANNNANGTEFVIPPLWKRVAAEIVDFVVLFYMKIIVTVVLMRQMGYLRDDNILDVQLDLMPILDLTEVDIDKAFAMTSEIIALEVVNRVFITLFEALCIRRGYGAPGGATPGKRILGLKVVSCEQVIDLRNGRVLIVPAEDIGILSALVRSVIKNFTVAFLFPACFTVFFFQNNRTAYDVLAKTIVVQTPHNHRR